MHKVTENAGQRLRLRSREDIDADYIWTRGRKTKRDHTFTCHNVRLMPYNPLLKDIVCEREKEKEKETGRQSERERERKI